MPIATPTLEGAPVACLNCGTPLFFRAVGDYHHRRYTWHHLYRGQFHGQMTCDPQLAREAAKPLMGQLA